MAVWTTEKRTPFLRCAVNEFPGIGDTNIIFFSDFSVSCASQLFRTKITDLLGSEFSATVTHRSVHLHSRI